MMANVIGVVFGRNMMGNQFKEMCIARGVAKGFLYKIPFVFFFTLSKSRGEKVTEIDVLRGL